MSPFAETEARFVRALLDPSQPTPASIRGARRRRADRRFAVHRNNVVAGLVNTVGERFPVVRRLVGDDFFTAMARAYVTAHPPRSPIVMHYGETFPAFVDNFAPAAAVPYLGDVARIEMARGRAYHAADVEPVDTGAFAAVPPEQIADVHLEFHPSISVIASPHPIVSIWRVNHDPDHAVPISPWAAEAALVARPGMEVEVTRLPRGAAAFFDRLRAGGTIAQAAAGTIEEAGTFDLVESLKVLVSARVVTAIRGRIAVTSGPKAAPLGTRSRAIHIRHRTEDGVALA
jgi:hypothetical protein